MSIIQITIQMENKSGKLSQTSELMSAETLNIRAISANENDGGKSTVRIIVEDPERAANALTGKGIEYKLEEVLAVEVPDHPGGLLAVLKPLKEHKINVEFMYPAIGKHGKNAIMIIGTKELKKAEETLRNNYIHLLGNQVYHL